MIILKCSIYVPSAGGNGLTFGIPMIWCHRSAWPGPSYFDSGSKYFPSRIVLDVTGDVTD